MPILQDEEFGPIKVRVSPLAKYVRLRISPDGTIAGTLPKRAPMRLFEKLLDNSRESLRKNLSQAQLNQPTLQTGSIIGKSHKLVVLQTGSQPSNSLKGLELQVNLPPSWQITDRQSQNYIREASLKALRKEAKAYLPRQVAHLALKYGFADPKLRFTSGTSRWGSCSARGDISLNINCMNLPFELIDYVIVHELCHTRHHNHSKDFWDLVSSCLPDFKDSRKSLKKYSPIPKA